MLAASWRIPEVNHTRLILGFISELAVALDWRRTKLPPPLLATPATAALIAVGDAGGSLHPDPDPTGCQRSRCECVAMATTLSWGEQGTKK